MAIKNLNFSPEDKLVQSLEKKQAQAKSKLAQTPVAETIKPTTEPSVDGSIDQSIDQSTGQSTDQSMDRPMDEPTAQLIGSPVDRPVAFYIPKIIHKKIDEAVLYYQENRSKKIDRSAVVAALLADPEIWTHEALDRLAGKVIRQLTYRLTNRLVN